MKDTIRVTTTILLTLSVVGLAWQFWGIVLLFVVSLAVAAMMREPVEWLVGKGLSRGLSIGLVLFIGLGAIALLIFLITPILIDRIPLLIADFVTTYDGFKEQLAKTNTIQGTLARSLPSTDAIFGSLTSEEPGGIMQIAIGLTGSVLDTLVQSISVIFLAAYWSMDRTYFERLWLSLLPPNQRTQMRRTWRAIESDVGEYLRSEALQCIFGGFALFAVFFLIGVKYPVTLACLVALLWLLPVIGPLVAIVPTLIVGFISSPITAVIATILMLVLYTATQLFIVRRLYSSARFASTISLLMMLILVDAMGMVGLLVAPILASIFQIFLTNALMTEAAPIDAPTIQTLNERLEQMHQAMKNSSAATAPATANLANRLEKLVHQIELLAK